MVNKARKSRTQFLLLEQSLSLFPRALTTNQSYNRNYFAQTQTCCFEPRFLKVQRSCQKNMFEEAPLSIQDKRKYPTWKREQMASTKLYSPCVVRSAYTLRRSTHGVGLRINFTLLSWLWTCNQNLESMCHQGNCKGLPTSETHSLAPNGLFHNLSDI